MMIELWHKFLDIDEVYKTRAKKKMNLRCKKPDLEYPDVPDLYYRSVVEEINEIKNKPITVNDLMNVNVDLPMTIKDYVIPNSKSDDKPNNDLDILK